MHPAPNAQIDPREIPPHAPLTRYYERDRQDYVVDLFNRTAQHYDTIESLFLKGGLWYRRFGMKRAGMRPGMKVLDVATGTGAVARGAARIVGPRGSVFGCDPSPGMLAQAKRVFSGPLTHGVGDALPFRSELFDFVTMGIALRHVSSLARTFAEYLRVLKPGGRVWILEGHVPKSKLGHSLTRFVWAKLIPGMTLVSTGSREAKLLMDYYWDTVEKCVPPDTIVAAMRDAGFTDVKFSVVIPGAFCEYTGTRKS
jgi:demethylmenaquinone methyltransferase/2-methoxy-6-polyprenyl-1,4-benzoquinol methylase